MLKNDVYNKQIVLLTENDFFAKGITENCEDIQTSVQSHTDIKIFPKIDLLITDIIFPDYLLYTYKIKTLINITLDKKPLCRDEIRLYKPLSLNHLINLIYKNLNSSSIFCIIKDNLIYNESSNSLIFPKGSIKLTEKENEVFKYILLSQNFSTTKESMMKNIWQYHAESESLTLDTHLYKLKSKLPSGLLEVKNNICRLIK